MLAPLRKKLVSVVNGRLGMKVSIKILEMTEAGLQDEALNREGIRKVPVVENLP